MHYGKETSRNRHKSSRLRVFAKYRKFEAEVEPERSSRGPRRPPGAAPPLAAPGGRPGTQESGSDPTLARYLPFVAEIFAIYSPGSFRQRISRFHVFSFRSVSARVKSYCYRCLLVAQVERTSWDGVYVKSRKIATKGNT